MRMLEAFRSLQEAGLGVIDVGARGGINAVFRRIAPILEVVGFEPDAEEAQRLLQAGRTSSSFRSLTYLPCGLDDADGERLLYLCRTRGESSFYRPNRVFLDRFPDANRFDIVSTALVKVRSLDSLSQDPAIRLPRFMDFIKIDTQGNEFNILRGAEQMLRTHVVAVEVEVLFAPLYDSQSAFREVDHLLTTCGLRLFKLKRAEWVRGTYARRPHLSSGQLAFGDVLYLRDPLDAPHRWSPTHPHQLEALILVALLYDLHDFALELVMAPQWAGMLDVEALRHFVERRSRRYNSFFERLRMVHAICSSNPTFTRYAPRRGRGDDNFYSAI